MPEIEMTKTTVDIKDLVENKNYVVVFDTNVFLNLYRHSPDLVDFLFRCMEIIKPHIIVPRTIYIEVVRNHRALYAKRQKSIDESVAGSIKLIAQQKEKTLKSCCGVLERGGFPDVDKLIGEVEEKYKEVEELLHSYFDDHKVLTLIKDSWTSDLPFDFVEELLRKGQIMKGYTMSELYDICDEGEKRYGKKTPPGYKDEKAKDGFRKYSDLIWWKEVIRFAKENKKNIILVTDDIKEDWWVVEDSTHKFREELFKEFEKETANREKDKKVTHSEIKPYLSKIFFDLLATAYDVERSDAIDIALSLTDDDYINSVEEKVFDKIIDELSYSGDKYLDADSMSRIGSEGIEEWEIEDYEYQDYEMIERDGNIVTYIITYEVKLYGTSYDYWGRDDETKEIYLSPEIQHTVKGIIEVEVGRNVDMMLDFNDDNEFEYCGVIDGRLKEIKYKDTAEDEYWGEDDCN